MTIYLIVFAGLLSFTNYIGSRVLMSLYALELGASALAVGLLISLYAVFPFAVSVYAGRLVDRVGSFQPMLVGVSIDHGGYLVTFLLLTLLAVMTTVGWGAVRGLVPDSKHHGAPPSGARTTDLLRNPELRRVVVISALTVAGVDLYSFYLPIYGHTLGHSATTIGVLSDSEARQAARG